MFVRLMTSLLISSLLYLFLGEPLRCLVPPHMIEIEVHINSIPVLYWKADVRPLDDLPFDQFLSFFIPW